MSLNRLGAPMPDERVAVHCAETTPRKGHR